MKKKALSIFVIALLVVAIFSWIGFRQYDAETLVSDWSLRFSHLEHWAPIAWVLLFGVLAAVFFPVAVLSISSGVLFGVATGTFLTLLGATLAATLSMLAGRWLVGDVVEQKAGPRVLEMKSRVDAEGWRFVAFTRLVPLLPFALLNFSYGATHIKVLPYMVTTFVFMLPARWAYAYAGDVGWDVFTSRFESIQLWLIAAAIGLSGYYLPRVFRR